MIIQLGALLGGLFSEAVGSFATGALDVGKLFLQRELNRKLRRRQSSAAKAQAIQVLNTPGISVASLGGNVQAVGGPVQRPTFFGSSLGPVQNRFGNIPFAPVPQFAAFQQPQGGFQARPRTAVSLPALGGLASGTFKAGQRFGDFLMGPPAPSTGPFIGPIQTQNGGGMAGAPGEPKYAKDQFGKVIKFVVSPRPGEGFLPLAAAQNLGLNVSKPHWRFNRLQGQYEKLKARRMNPFNFAAAARAGKRIDRTLDAVKMVVSVQNAKDKGVQAGGKVIKFRTKKKKRAC